MGAALVAGACAGGRVEPGPRVAPRAATEAAITVQDLQMRLGAYAHDSMLGREAGTIGNVRATNYLAAEARRLGLEPAGDNGAYFQTIPLMAREVDPATSIVVDGRALALWKDFAAVPPFPGFLPFGATGSLDGVRAVYAGRLADESVSLTEQQTAGKLVVFDAPLDPNGNPAFRIWAAGGLDRYPNAAGVAVASLDLSPPGLLNFFQQTQEVLSDPDSPDPRRPLGMIITRETARRLFGEPLDSVRAGAEGQRVQGTIRFREEPLDYPARNVVAILRGSDPALRGQYVAIGAHNDHVGMASAPADHDSLRAFNTVVRPKGADDPQRAPNEQEAGRIQAVWDSLKVAHRARVDSVFNGADDDGSGSMAVLEIAEAFAGSAQKPRRSILFVWHTAEEKGLFGAQYFTDHPTVARDSIVAQVNLDMIGRGGETDLENGGPGYLQLIGSRRLSTELGDLVERVNQRQGHRFTFDYQYDADGHPASYYCRSDHYMYARYGIPVVFASSGGHRDYHQLTDEPQYISYPKLARVTQFIHDVVAGVANQDHRPVVDKPKPDPFGDCQQ